MLVDTLLVLFFFFIIMAIAGLQLFSGILKNRCVNIDSGKPHDDDEICGGRICPEGYFCGKTNKNPDEGGTNFDNFLSSFLQVFISVSLEGWTEIMNKLWRANAAWVIAYSLIIVFVGTFFLQNLTLAVIKSKFTEEHHKQAEKKAKEKLQLKKEGRQKDQKQSQDNQKEEDEKDSPSSKKGKEKSTSQTNPLQVRKDKDKERIGDLIRRLEGAMNEKEIRDKFTPRNGFILQSQRNKVAPDESSWTRNSQFSSYMAKDKKETSLASQEVQPLELKAMPITNYGEFLSQKIGFASPGRVPQKEDGASSQYTPITPSEFLSNFIAPKDLMEKNTSKVFPWNRQKRRHTIIQKPDETIKEDDNESHEQTRELDNSSNLEVKINKPSRLAQETHSDNLNSGPRRYRTNSSSRSAHERESFLFKADQQKRLSMKAIANTMTFKDKETMEEIERKQAIYDQITKDFDIYKFLDDDVLGDSYQSKSDNGEQRTQLLQADSGIRNEGQRDVPAILRESPGATLESKFLNKVARSKQQNPLFNQKSLNSNGETRRLPKLQRCQTQISFHRDYCFEREEQAVQIQAIKSFKQKAHELFKRHEKQAKVKDSQLPRQGAQKLEAENFKASSKSLDRSVFRSSQKIAPDVTKQNKNTRSMSEALRSFYRDKAQQLYQERQLFVKRRRNKFFAQAVRGINKTKTQLFDEEVDRLKQKALVQLGGGFELPSLTNAHIDIRKLRRSGSDDFLKNTKHPRVANSSGLSPILRNNGYFDKELQRELDAIRNFNRKKEPAFTGNEADDSIMDIDKVLLETKKKIHILPNKIQFTSKEEVLELRPKKSNLPNDTAEDQEDGKKGLKIPNWMHFQSSKIKGYQKKILQKPKTNFEELLIEEAQESDDNQEKVLKRLEDCYNYPHRSHIYVTGTLSLVINDQHENKKIMNSNYFSNIEKTEQNYGAKSSSKDVVPALNLMNNSDGAQNISSSFRTVNSPEKSLDQQSMTRSPTHKHQSLRRGFTKTGISGKRSSRATNSKQRKSLLGASSTGRRQSNLGATTPLSRSSFTFGAGSSRSQALKAQVFGKRVEYLTDNQILKRLNKEFRRSEIFSAMKFRKLPAKIYKDETEDKLCKDNQKHNKANQPVKAKQSSALNADDEESESSQGDAIYDTDIFLDKEDLNCEENIRLAKESAKTKSKDSFEWSGQDVMSRFDPQKAKIAISSLSAIRVWPYGNYGYFKRVRMLVKVFVKNSYFDNFFIMCVALNVIALTLDHYGISEEHEAILQLLNTIFTILFTIEMGTKLLGIGVVNYLSDRMNYLDGIVVVLSLVEAAFASGGDGNDLSAFQTIRVFRTFRVLRVARLLKSMKSMVNILAVISRSISSFMYLAMLLLLFIFIYALLGMQAFGDQLDFEDGPDGNYDTFHNAFVTSFHILTTEDWHEFYYETLKSDVNWLLSILYFISWIFIGNWILLNLFLAILLDSFTTQEEEDNQSLAQQKEQEKQTKDDIISKKGEDFIVSIGEMLDSKHASRQAMSKGKGLSKKKKEKKQQAWQTNILDESLEINAESLQQQKQEAKKIKQLYENIECESAFYLLKKRNKFRILMYKLAQTGMFETVILILIILSSAKLIYDTYILELPQNDPVIQISTQIDYFFTACFTVEALIKSFAYGFFLDKNSYLRESWSQLDFFIVLTSLIDASLTNLNLPVIRILRLLRILRPLRVMSHNSSMKTMVVALLQSGESIANVSIVVFLVFLMFAIVTVNIFGGKMQYCTVDKFENSTPEECFEAKGQWATFHHNYDNFPNAMVTLFIIASQEGWPAVMYQTINGDVVGRGPKVNANPGAAYFFIVFVFIGTYFLMNLFVGVIFMEFEKAQNDEKDSLFLTAYEMNWVDMTKMIVKARPEFTMLPKNRISKLFFTHTKPESKFDIAIMICIILNMILMALNYEGQTERYTLILTNINFFFTALFALEAIFKIIGQGWQYFTQSWNQFDFFVVLASFVDIFMGAFEFASLNFLRVGPQLARVLRVLRVSRLFRLLNKYKGLQALLQTIIFSLPPLFNVFALMGLVYFIFSVLAVFLFNEIKEGNMIDEYSNFNNFGLSLLTLFRSSTGEGWPNIMFDTINTSEDCIKGVTCGTDLSPLFFVIFLLVCQYIMLNLFVLVILQQFELYYLPDDNILQTFRDDLEQFKVVWSKFARDHDGIKVRQMDLPKFFKELKGNLGMLGDDEKEVIRSIIKLDLESDEDGFVYFNDLLYRSMKRKYGTEKTNNKVLANIEFKTFEKLEKIKDKMMKKSRSTEKVKAVSVNPFLTIMYKGMSFNAWLKQYRENLDQRQQEIMKEEERELSFEGDFMKEDEEDDFEYVTEEDLSVHSEDEGNDSVSNAISSNDCSQYRQSLEGQGLQETVKQGGPNKAFTIKLQKTRKFEGLSESNDKDQAQSLKRQLTSSFQSSYMDDSAPEKAKNRSAEIGEEEQKSQQNEDISAFAHMQTHNK